MRRALLALALAACEATPATAPAGLTCLSQDPCRVRSPGPGGCVEAPAPDGTPCALADPCLSGACVAGFCEGTPRCDDGDACTEDTCRDGACGHEPVSCPDPGGCLDAACDPRTGCGARPAPDGEACEGPCEAGTCSGGSCLAPGDALEPLWDWPGERGYEVGPDLVVDERDGSALLAACGPPDDTCFVVRIAGGEETWRSPLAAIASRLLLAGDVLLAVDGAGLHARSAADGAPLWDVPGVLDVAYAPEHGLVALRESPGALSLDRVDLASGEVSSGAPVEDRVMRSRRSLLLDSYGNRVLARSCSTNFEGTVSFSPAGRRRFETCDGDGEVAVAAYGTRILTTAPLLIVAGEDEGHERMAGWTGERTPAGGIMDGVRFATLLAARREEGGGDTPHRVVLNVWEPDGEGWWQREFDASARAPRVSTPLRLERGLGFLVKADGSPPRYRETDDRGVETAACLLAPGVQVEPWAVHAGRLLAVFLHSSGDGLAAYRLGGRSAAAPGWTARDGNLARTGAPR